MEIIEYLCNVKRKFVIFILFVIGLAAYVAGPIDMTSNHIDAYGAGQYEIEMISVHDSNSSVSCDNAFDNPVSSIIFAHFSNILSGQARTINRCMRLVYRYNPIAFLKNGKKPYQAFSSYLQKSGNAFHFVKPHGGHGVIRFCKLLI